MTRFLTMASFIALLAACDNQQPLDFGLGGDDTPVDLPDDDGPLLDDDGEEVPIAGNGIPEAIAGTLDGVSYDPNAGTLEVRIRSLDSTPESAVYERTPALDVPGYIAYTQQEDPLDRFFVSYVQTSEDEATVGALVMDGGQFQTFIAGTNYAQAGGYTVPLASQPDNGLVAYTGYYIGILNFPELDTSLLLTPGTGVSPDLRPRQPARVQGEVLINADFVNMSVNGGIAERTIVSPTFLDADLPAELLNVGLEPSDIAADGTFFGNAKVLAEDIGAYGGTFGGEDASGVAIGVHLDGDFIKEIDDEEEYGVIVLTKCGLPGDGPFCPDVQPDF